MRKGKVRAHYILENEKSKANIIKIHTNTHAEKEWRQSTYILEAEAPQHACCSWNGLYVSFSTHTHTHTHRGGTFLFFSSLFSYRVTHFLSPLLSLWEVSGKCNCKMTTRNKARGTGVIVCVCERATVGHSHRQLEALTHIHTHRHRERVRKKSNLVWLLTQLC